MLNFAPAIPNYTRELFDCVDYLILNEVEIEQLVASASFSSENNEDVKRACTSLLEKYTNVSGVIVTIGAKGVIYAERSHLNEPVHVASQKVNVVDSTVSWEILNN